MTLKMGGLRKMIAIRARIDIAFIQEDTATPTTPLAPFNFAALLNASSSSRPDDQMTSDSHFDKDTTLCYPSSSLHDDDERDVRQVTGADAQRGELPAISEEDARDDEQVSATLDFGILRRCTCQAEN